MSLVDHARRELELSGQTAEDPGYAASIIAAVEAFASYGHSGGSAMVAIEQLHILLQHRTLSPLTSDPAEWEDRSKISSTPLWQNRRDPAAMSTDGGQDWFYVDKRGAADLEQHCQRCDGPNISWSAPSPLWNQVMRDGSITGPWQYGEIICPLCFAELASEQGITGPHWRFFADEVEVGLELETPSGRVWNPGTWLWDTPGEEMRHDYVDALGHAPLRTEETL
jgi:hypothetical protein